MKKKAPLVEELLSTLSKKELSQFSDFVLRSKISEEQKIYWGKVLQTIEYSKNSLKPQINFDFQKQRNHTNKLLKQLENFITLQYLENNSLEKELILSKAMLERNALRNSKKSLKRIEKFYASNESKNVAVYEAQSFLKTELLKLNIDTEPRKKIPEYQSIKTAEKKSFLIKYLLVLISELSSSRVMKQNATSSFYNETNDWLSVFVEEIGDSEPVIKLLFEWISFLDKPCSEKYISIKDLFWGTWDKMDRTLQLNLFASLLNEITACENKSPKLFTGTLHEIYSKGESLGIFSPESFHPAMVKNYLLTCLRLKKFNQAKLLIKRYSNHLPNGYKEYVIALLNFHQGDVYLAKDSLNNLFRGEGDYLIDVFFSQGVRILDLQVACELALISNNENDYNHAISKAIAYINYLRRHNKINPDMLEASLASARLIKRLLTARKMGDYKRILKDMDMENSDRADWLEEKASEAIRHELGKLSRSL